MQNLTQDQIDDWGLAEDHAALINSLIDTINSLESRVATLEGQ